jgi:cation transport regulator ChaC
MRDRSRTRKTNTQYVFAYGSLLRDLSGSLGEGMTPCGLREHRRVWNVAMDNTLSLPGYKYYLSAGDCSRPAVFVTFLNIAPADGRHVSGVLFAVGAEELEALDRRERNYDRREVTSSIEQPPPGRVWAYFGKPQAERRFALAAQQRRAVIDKTYLEKVRSGFGLIAADGLDEFDATTDPHDCPVLDLRRIDL